MLYRKLTSMYYQDKITTLKDIFDEERITVGHDFLAVGNRAFPVVNDVIILVPPAQYTDFIKKSISKERIPRVCEEKDNEFARDIQFTFGEEWKSYSSILPEHEKEFCQYFDIVNPDTLNKLRVCDLGCGMGRWSYFLKAIASEIILVDFSDSIFIARKNLAGAGNCFFFMCDLKKLPFRDDFADFLFSLGVLHHLPANCLDEVRSLKRFARTLHVFLYYSLDNRPFYFRFALNMVTAARKKLCRIENRYFRKGFSLAGAYLLYMPLILLGHMLKPFKLSRYVPLYEFYHAKSAKRIEQDVYDRFFTAIEQRVSKKDILTLEDSFSEVKISDNLPYWHFVCKR
ncbi:MAG: class I SAM-dependent methyltransferase [Candidatus Firestonebacteria bacterium]